MFAVEMWFGVEDGVECGRSTGLCPLPLGVPRCVIHNKKNVGMKFLVFLKKNKYKPPKPFQQCKDIQRYKFFYYLRSYSLKKINEQRWFFHYFIHTATIAIAK